MYQQAIEAITRNPVTSIYLLFLTPQVVCPVTP